MIGCNCPVCRSADPRDARLRCSALIQIAGKKILIDTGPDFRQQALRHHITRLDAIVITHNHYDHLYGLDDVRPLGSVSVYGEPLVLKTIYETMPYCFGEHKYPGSPTIHLHEVTPYEPFMIEDVSILPLRVTHGRLPIVGRQRTARRHLRRPAGRRRLCGARPCADTGAQRSACHAAPQPFLPQ